jgi:5-methyltetrahydrofolate--homocysteine methyltransferase
MTATIIRPKIAHTVISSATREVVIGFDRPFTIIGERINPTGRKLLAIEMKAGDFSRVERDAIAQVEAGAHMLDVNAGIPLADEPAILAKTIQLVQSLVDVPLSIDSSIVEALEAGLAAYVGKPLVNSVTGEEERMERVLPLIRKYGAAVVAISNDDTGISEDPDVRFEVARRIVERAADHGIPREDVIVDPLVMPIGAMATAGQQVFRLVRRLREELGVNTTCGASNVSFGMPDRERINAAFLPMAIASGLTSAITNPLAAEVKAAIMAADVLMGNDQDASRWIRAHRDAAAAVAAVAAPARVAAASSISTTAASLSVIEGGSPDARPAGNRPRINRRALAAASAMRDAAGGSPDR